MSFHIESIPNRANKPAILLREAWREGSRIRKRTIANLSRFPPAFVDGFRIILRGGVAVEDLSDLLHVERSWAHGHVAAVLGTCRRLGLERILHRRPSRQRDLALAAVVARVLAPDSKLATARRLSPDTADSSLGTVLGLGPVSGNEMLALLDWLLARQQWIQTSLANRHLQDATLILYDVSSSYLEGRRCPLAAFGYNRDGKRGKQQIVFGLLCAADGCPLAVEVFAGNTADPTTVGPQVARIRQRFGIARIALVGDRGDAHHGAPAGRPGAGRPGLDLGPHEPVGAHIAQAPPSRLPGRIRTACRPPCGPPSWCPTRWPRSAARTFPTSVCWCA